MKKFKLIQAGYGHMGRFWAKILKENEDVEVVGVYDISHKILEEAAKDYSDKFKIKTSKNLEELIKETNADIILDTTPPFNHINIAQIALTHGKSVISEKPMTQELEDTKKINELSSQTDKLFYVSQNYRWHPMVSKIKSILNSNKLGNIKAIYVDYQQTFNLSDTFRKDMDHPLLYEMSIHHFDLLRAFTNTIPQDVFCKEFNSSNGWYKNGSSCICTFTMSENIIFNYRGSWSNIGNATGFNGKWTFIGEKGTLYWEGDNEARLEYIEDFSSYTNIKEILITPEFYLENDNQKLSRSLNHYINCLNGKEIPETAGQDNIYSLSMVCGAIQSSNSGSIYSIKKSLQ